MGITAQQIDQKIAELKQQAENVQGTECEVYTRIVGYYRPLKNWNPGKVQEYKERKLFKPGMLK